MFDTVAWAADGSWRDDRLLVPVRDLCYAYGSALWIVHVAQGGDRPREAPESPTEGEWAVTRLKVQTSLLRRQGIRAALHVVRGASGPPTGHLLDVVTALGAGLLVVAAQGLADGLAAAAGCPVLVLPV